MFVTLSLWPCIRRHSCRVTDWRSARFGLFSGGSIMPLLLCVMSHAVINRSVELRTRARQNQIMWTKEKFSDFLSSSHSRSYAYQGKLNRLCRLQATSKRMYVTCVFTCPVSQIDKTSLPPVCAQSFLNSTTDREPNDRPNGSRKENC